MPKLNQVIAIEKGVKSRVYSEVTELHKTCQKPDLFNGFSKVYRKQNDDSEDYPPERKKVQFKADDVLDRIAKLDTELFNTTATKDWANCNAVADIMLDGEVLLEKVPATYLLFLEKQLTDIHTFLEKMPILDESEEWTKDTGSGLYKTLAISTHKTKKTQKPIVMYDATVEHPAQTQLITEDVLVGYWDTVKHSGTLPAPRKEALIERVEKLLIAVKFAREEANSTDATNKFVGEKLFGYLFAE